MCQPSQKAYGHCVLWMGVAIHIMNGVLSEMCVGNGGHQVQDGGLLFLSCPFHVERHYHETYLVVRVTILIWMHLILRSCFYAVSLINVKVILPEHYSESILT